MRLRAATEGDLDYLRHLACHPDVEPFLAPGAADMLGEWAAAEEPFGLYVIEAAPGKAVGGLALQLGSEHSQICSLRTVMVDPVVRRAGIGARAVWLACHCVLVEHGFHRVQTESYGDNLAAHRLFERVGFVREGVRRRAYWRREQWIDGVIYGMLAEELRDGGTLAG